MFLKLYYTFKIKIRMDVGMDAAIAIGTPLMWAKWVNLCARTSVSTLTPIQKGVLGATMVAEATPRAWFFKES